MEWLGEIPAHWDVKPFRSAIGTKDSGDGVTVRTGEEGCSPCLHLTERDGQAMVEKNVQHDCGVSHEAAQDIRLGAMTLLLTKSRGCTGCTSASTWDRRDESAPRQRLSSRTRSMQRQIRVASTEDPGSSVSMNTPVAREQLVFLSSTIAALRTLSGRLPGKPFVVVPHSIRAKNASSPISWTARLRRSTPSPARSAKPLST